MQNSELVAIVPNLPPAIDGIGDYGLNLARQLYQDFGWKTRFIVGSPDWQGEQEEFFQVTPVTTRSQDALLKLLPAPAATVLLHYAGHGYAPRGCPAWLVKALKRWCQSGGRLVTMFHELYATEPLLSSAILTSPLQKHLAIQLMELSDRVLTSRKQYAEKIEQLSRRQHSKVPNLPIFSTIGELAKPMPLIERSRQVIVFGGSGARLRVYQRSRSALIRICRELGIQEIIDIGAKLNFEIEPIEGIEFRALGIQPADEISRYMSCASIGFLDYSTSYLGKSTIFAAYCSHGMLPVTGSKDAPNEDGLRAGQHYWLANSEQLLNFEQGQAIANTAYQWYQVHSLSAQSAIFAKNLTRNALMEITA
jgi:hypothetical protein